MAQGLGMVVGDCSGLSKLWFFTPKGVVSLEGGEVGCFVGFMCWVPQAMAGHGRGGRAWEEVAMGGRPCGSVSRVSGKHLEAAEVVVASGSGSEGGGSRMSAGEKMTLWQGSNSARQLVGGCSETRGWLVSAVRAAEWTKAVSQRRRWPLQLPTCWTLALVASNVGCCPCLCPTRPGGQRL